MRKINKQDVFRLVLVLALVAGIGFAMGAIGRFVPTHKIVQPVYCGSCHPEQVEELNETTHLAHFAGQIEAAVENTKPNGAEDQPAARYISGGCTMCHNYWDNFKWFGMKNVNISLVEKDNPDLGRIQTESSPTDIYGNAVSPYGLGSTESYIMNITGKKYAAADQGNPNYPPNSDGTTYNEILVAWPAGLDVYQYEYQGNTYSRLDYVWSLLSSLSPGPVGYQVIDNTTKLSIGGCGTAEKGMCHAAADAVALSMQDYKREFPEYPNTANGSNSSLWINGTHSTVTGINPASMKTLTGSGTFFQHEMAFTTAQYAAKPVKLCGACHVFKLPPMRWGGEPWAVKDIWDYTSTGSVNGDPFGFRPRYDLTGDASLTYEVKAKWGGVSQQVDKEFNVLFRTPDWAHANVPCIRCHVHAGLNDKMVSGNEAEFGTPGPTVPSPIPPSPGSVPGAQADSGYIDPYKGQ